MRKREKLTPEERFALALDLIKREHSFADVCSHYHVSHTTAYKIRNAFLEAVGARLPALERVRRSRSSGRTERSRRRSGQRERYPDETVGAHRRRLWCALCRARADRAAGAARRRVPLLQGRAGPRRLPAGVRATSGTDGRRPLQLDAPARSASARRGEAARASAILPTSGATQPSRRRASRPSVRGSRARCRRSRGRCRGWSRSANQLGTLKLALKSAEQVLRPASGLEGPNGAPALPPTEVDDFKCYAARVARAPRGAPPVSALCARPARGERRLRLPYAHPREADARLYARRRRGIRARGEGRTSDSWSATSPA